MGTVSGRHVKHFSEREKMLRAGREPSPLFARSPVILPVIIEINYILPLIFGVYIHILCIVLPS